MKRVTSVLTLLIAASLCGSACVYSPENGTVFAVDQNLSLGGLASQPGATVQLTAFNKETESWDQLDEVTASTYPLHFNDDKTLYQWSMSFRMDDVPNWECYYHPSCTIPSEGLYEVRFQFLEPGGDSSFLYTFDEGGLACWNQHYNNGEDIYVAYWNCKAQIFDELRLQSGFVF